MTLTIGSLFSGIGGLEYGLELTGGFRTIWQCENNPYASAVLKKHWCDEDGNPTIPNYGDITKVDWSKVRKPDLICGGFPCQDISIAGRQKGIKGSRSGLWKEFARAIEGTEPKWVVIENSPELVRLGLDEVLSDLRLCGYQPLRPLVIPASAVGAKHKRERLFIVAHINKSGCDYGNTSRSRGQVLPDERGNCEENQQERSQRERGTCQNASFPSDADESSKQRHIGKEVFGKCGISWWHDARSIEEITQRPDVPEPLVCRRVYGLSKGLHRVACLGNAVVPQVAQVVGEMILEMEKEASE